MSVPRRNDRRRRLAANPPPSGDSLRLPAGPRPPAAPSSAERQRSPWPATGEKLPAVFLRAAVRQVLIYRKRVERVEAARPGDLVAVYGPEDELLGYGLFNSLSEIVVRMLTFGAVLPDEAFWQGRLAAAVELRRGMLRLDEAGSACRLVHAEGDGLSGLVVDRFADVLSAEAFSLGMYQRAEELLRRLAAICGARHTLLRASPQFLSQEGCEPPPLASPELPRQVVVEEFGTRFRVQFSGGHKTGFFCDQRDNRRRLADFCGGRSVLDLCCYSGGFAVQAKRLGGAAEVTGVDLDEEPLQLARENARLNRVAARFVQADVFPYMRDMLAQGRRYDVVVLDPPKLIRTRAEIEDGTRKHFDLNRLAMQLVAPGGLLLTCCCSGLLGDEEFRRLVAAAARQAGPPCGEPDAEGRRRHAPRTLQILSRTGAAADHPVAANVPEGEYLKAIWARLE